MQPDELDHLVGPLVPRLLLDAVDLQPVRDVVDHLAVRQQAEVLEDHREAGAAQFAQPRRRRPCRMSSPLTRTLPGGRLDQPGQAPHERRLARARQPHDDEHLARGHVEARRRGRRRRSRSALSSSCGLSSASRRARRPCRRSGRRPSTGSARRWPRTLLRMLAVPCSAVMRVPSEDGARRTSRSGAGLMFW